MATTMQRASELRETSKMSPRTVAEAAETAMRRAGNGAELRLLIAEAEEIIKAHPRTPAGWRRNVHPFLLRCVGHTPYVSRWRWALRCLRERRPHIKAPFRYFETVLVSETPYKPSPTARAIIAQKPTMDLEVERRRLERRYFWLKATKGVVAARTWGIKVGIRKRDMRALGEELRAREAQKLKLDPALIVHDEAEWLITQHDEGWEALDVVDAIARGRERGPAG